MGSIKHAEWQSRGYRIHASVHEPAEPAGSWVVFSHGFTGHRIGPEYLYVFLSRYLADHGVGSVRFDFAGAGESEGRFDEMLISTMVEDLRRSCSWVRDHYAPAHLVLLGHSLGGAVAALAAAHANAAGVILLAAVAHPMQLASQYSGVVEHGANGDGFYEVGAHEMSLSFLKDLENVDPLTALHQSACRRFLIIHGDDDRSVPTSESHAYVDALQDGDRAVRFECIHGVGHRFLSVGGRKRICRIINQWCGEHFT